MEFCSGSVTEQPPFAEGGRRLDVSERRVLVIEHAIVFVHFLPDNSLSGAVRLLLHLNRPQLKDGLG